MEFDKRKNKKRPTTGELQEGNALTKKFKKGEEGSAVAGGSGAGDPAAVPTEDEVEQFFAILRRMKVAVDYFDQKGKGGKEWREALEQVDFTVDDDGEDEGNRRDSDSGAVKKDAGREAVTNEGFDLNATAPEAADA